MRRRATMTPGDCSTESETGYQTTILTRWLRHVTSCKPTLCTHFCEPVYLRETLTTNLMICFLVRATMHFYYLFFSRDKHHSVEHVIVIPTMQFTVCLSRPVAMVVIDHGPLCSYATHLTRSIYTKMTDHIYLPVSSAYCPHISHHVLAKFCLHLSLFKVFVNDDPLESSNCGTLFGDRTCMAIDGYVKPPRHSACVWQNFLAYKLTSYHSATRDYMNGSEAFFPRTTLVD